MNTAHWTAGIHHDGSSLYVSHQVPAFGDVVQIRLRTPIDAPIREAHIRTEPDGEPHTDDMQVVEENGMSKIWQGEISISMPRMTYRFRLLTDEGTWHVNALGASRAELPDHFDFKLVADYPAPEWVNDSVFYQIFPDRFHNGDPSNDVPDGAWERRGFKTQRRAWDDPPQPWAEAGNVDYYGGDLVGIQQKLGYLQELGVNALYLNPIFAARSNHRYDIMDFHKVDLYLGGDEALVELRKALDERDMKLMLDVTPNHLSWDHPFFKEAQADLNGEKASYFTFYDDDPDNYEKWLGVPSLVKINYEGEAVREWFYRAKDSVLRYWMAAPFRIDGWRLDVQNMTARQRQIQLGQEIWREAFAAVKGDNPALYFMGENAYDGTPYLQGDQLDAIMNYQGFNFPVRNWVTGYDGGSEWGRVAVDAFRLESEGLVEQLKHYLAAVPWVIAKQQFNQLDNHDIVRFMHACGDDVDRYKLGLVLLMTYVGVPCLYYGDEIGMTGATDPDNRRPMQWDESAWDADLLAFTKKLIALRRTALALVKGGLQFLYHAEDIVVYQRQADEQRLIVIVYRGEFPMPTAHIPVWHSGLAESAKLRDLITGQTVTVSDGALQLTRIQPLSAYILEAI